MVINYSPAMFPVVRTCETSKQDLTSLEVLQMRVLSGKEKQSDFNHNLSKEKSEDIRHVKENLLVSNLEVLSSLGRNRRGGALER